VCSIICKFCYDNPHQRSQSLWVSFASALQGQQVATATTASGPQGHVNCQLNFLAGTSYNHAVFAIPAYCRSSSSRHVVAVGSLPEVQPASTHSDLTKNPAILAALARHRHKNHAWAQLVHAAGCKWFCCIELCCSAAACRRCLGLGVTYGASLLHCQCPAHILFQNRSWTPAVLAVLYTDVAQQLEQYLALTAVTINSMQCSVTELPEKQIMICNSQQPYHKIQQFTL
jgi:hypothetical protein